MTQAAERLSALERTDKCVIGNAGTLLFAPPHPRFLHHPGLWDVAHVYNHEVGPLLAVSLVRADGRAVLLRLVHTSWRPDRFQRTFIAGDGMELVETISAVGNDRFAFEWEVYGVEAGDSLHLVAWTAFPVAQPARGVHVTGVPVAASSGIGIPLVAHMDRLEQPPLTLQWHLTLQAPDAVDAVLSQGVVPSPDWSLTPFHDVFDDGLAPRTPLSDVPLHDDGHVFVAAACRIEPGRSVRGAVAMLSDSLGTLRSAALSDNWNDFYDRAPRFSCSDPYLERFFDYRLFGLRMNALPGGSSHIPQPVVTEGPGYFRAPITYSAQCLLMEARWLPSPDLAQGSLDVFEATQAADGAFRGYLGPSSFPGEFFYHADWGRILELHAVHEDAAFLKRSYTSLARYVEFFDRTRDPESSGLYDILNHYETGQEYMHRYTAVEADADRQHWGSVFRLKGVDVSVYLYNIKQALVRIADLLDLSAESTKWSQRAGHTGTAITGRMWCPDEQMFFDIDPRTGKRTGVHAATCFYPFLTDLVTTEHLPALDRHLLDPESFWTTWPVPSSSLKDPLFDPDGRWKGQRMNCPWNGRVWPMTNSHMVEVLARSADRFGRSDLRERTAELLTRFVHMMFFDGDVDRPNTFEHYHPFNGRASVFRGVDDYQHSWVLDLLVRYVAGIRPSAEGLVVDPYPFDVETVRISNVTVRGHSVTVARTGPSFTVTVGDAQHAGTIGTPLHLVIS